MAKRFFTVVLALCLSLPAHANNLLDQLPGLNTGPSTNAHDFLPVDSAFAFNFVEQDKALHLSWQVAEEYYLYQAQFIVEADGQSLDLSSRLPQGKLYNDAYFGEVMIYPHDVSFSLPLSEFNNANSITVAYQGCAEAGLCYPPETKSVFLSQSGSALTDSANSISDADNNSPAQSASTESVPISQQWVLAERLTNSSIWLNTLLFFVLGIGLAFTPCVFPMYPILTGIIAGSGKQLSSKRAFSLSLAYVQGMAVTFTALGLVVASAGLQFQAALQHPVILGSLAILFVVLALSMFGVFNLQLPSNLQQKLNNLSNKQQAGSLTGAAIMGMISGLVASPCTAAPLSGVLIYVAQSGDIGLGALTLYSLSLGMGLPLLILGASSGRLLPKAGAWMNHVKTFFGVMLLAVAVLLLERFIPASAVHALWAVLVIGASAYYYHQNRLTVLSAWQTARQLILSAIMIVALLWAAQPWLSPPQAIKQGEFIRVANLEEMQQQLALAAAQGKPALVDFYADWCTACKAFENETFHAPQVAAKLDNMVLIQADVTKTNATAIKLLGHYEVLGLPTILLFNHAGEELNQARVTGFMNAEAFKAHLILNGL
ncbi:MULTISPECIES: protein-disulfide reductase DsbD [unclassified Agarivorans]|uniref:protein-disulfide reductase DsbD n=1 Tax=unclassified Agarivorans TaxID=2636026 RepID=UPI0026E25306|nr:MULTISPECIES: protein-disulfide reductase DsbD [unclassified Agarivorans]MDO6686787.1 protein-disulfide reductase DsbD [Agarivorans sp. 3_MG-2023]MDO6716483.1 protein-disulfide reductase DsbD [Agarivorans sp. 2_MG-2023]